VTDHVCYVYFYVKLFKVKYICAFNTRIGWAYIVYKIFCFSNSTYLISDCGGVNGPSGRSEQFVLPRRKFFTRVTVPLDSAFTVPHRASVTEQRQRKCTLGRKSVSLRAVRL
jgi:hypothetical protein